MVRRTVISSPDTLRNSSWNPDHPECLLRPQVNPGAYTKPFLRFISENPTVFHAVEHFAHQLEVGGFEHLSERDLWTDKLKAGGKYYFERNGSGLIAFTIGKSYKPGNGAAIVASHVDALTAKLKPVSTKPTKAGYVQLGVAPYAGGLNQTWLDRDLGIGGKVILSNASNGKIESELVKLDWPIARIPSLAPHFGIRAEGQANKETRMVPIIGLDSDLGGTEVPSDTSPLLGSQGSFASTQSPRLLKVISSELANRDGWNIMNWELELFDTQPAQLGGLEKEFIFAGRVDDKLCSFAAIEGLLASARADRDQGSIKMVFLADDEEIGSLLRQGAKSNFLSSALERICEAMAEPGHRGANLLHQTCARSFMISADVTHAANPNYQDVYLPEHQPRLNVGICIAADSNGHMATDATSTAFLQCIAEKCGSKLQIFQIRNDSRSGGTVGPMLSAATGIRSIDAGLPQLSMHSIRATIGSLDPGLGVKLFKGFFDHYEEVDALFT